MAREKVTYRVVDSILIKADSLRRGNDCSEEELEHFLDYLQEHSVWEVYIIGWRNSPQVMIHSRKKGNKYIPDNGMSILAIDLNTHYLLADILVSYMLRRETKKRTKMKLYRALKILEQQEKNRLRYA